MSKSYLVYRALFPPFYSARTDEPTGDVDLDRHFHTLTLPQIRLFGPMWSFGIRVREVDDVRHLPGMEASDSGAASRSLRALYQMQDPIRLGKMKQYHTPVLMRAEVGSFLQPIFQELHEARMSLLALDTIRRQSIEGDELKDVSRFDLPVLKGQMPIIDGPDYPSICSSASIIASPFGDPPPPLNNPPASDRGQFLAAMQLMHGAIRFKPDAFYLSKVREQMGLGMPEPQDALPPQANERLSTIVLLPDGFCVAGTVQLPWLNPKAAITGWFKATFRHIDQRESVQRVLKLWFDPADPAHEVMQREWRGHLAQLERLLRASRGKPGQPQWLDFSPSTTLEPEHLFWPERGPIDVPLFSRLDAGSRVSIDSAALALRIADPERAADPAAVLTIQPESFELDRKDAQVIIAGRAGLSTPPDAGSVTASYRFAATPRSERLSLIAGGDAEQPVTLAAPLIETAELVRNATGLPRPAPDQAHLDLLWTFSPLPDGWLHWPLPNATEAALARLDPAPAPTDGNDDQRSASDGISGALAFGNLPGQPGFRASERTWSFSASDASAASVELSLDTAADTFGYVKQAAATFSGVALAFHGFATVTPFRQTAQRLLPDHAERALGSVGLMAVSPSSLHGIEADLWHHTSPASRLRFEVNLRGFVIEAEADGNARIADGANVSWTTTMSGTGLAHCAALMKPWVWKEHPVLPAIQALPRAVAGLARNAPSGGRALAPLRLQDAPLKSGKLVYSAPIHMTASGMAITMAYTELTNSGIKPAAFIHPNTGTKWRDEIGMAVTTLPSMTLFAGIPIPPKQGSDKEDDPPGPGDIELAADWAGLPARVYAELRHDIALRDEHNAFARAPGPTPPSPDAVPSPEAEPPLPPDPEFSPLPGNGQHGAGATSNGWDSVWRFLNRRAALAALDRRALLNKGKKGYALTGVFGYSDYALAKDGLKVDSTTVIAANEQGSKLEGIGCVTLDFGDNGETPRTLTLRGLPATSDLSGINGDFKRGDEMIGIFAGTAAVACKSGLGFTDQFGLSLAGSNNTGTLTIKRLYDEPGGRRGVMLVSLKEPLVLDKEANLEFHCTDVPLSEGGTDSFLGKFRSGADLPGRANAAGLESNHLAGFRWSLCRPDEPRNPVIVEGLLFEPLELCEMTLHQHAEIRTIKICGRLRLSVRSHKGTPLLPQSEGLAMLNIVRDEAGACTMTVTLEAPGVTWPLAEPATFPGMAPTLHFDQLPDIGKTHAATMRYRFGTKDTEVSIPVKRLADGSFTGHLHGSTVAGTGTGTDFTKLSIELTSAASPPAHAVTISYALRLGPAGARITGTCVRDLLSGATLLDGLQYEFSAENGEQMPIEVTADGPTEDRPGAYNASFDPRHIAVCWKSEAGQECRVLGGLRAIAGAGTLIATLAPAGDGAIDSYTTGQVEARAHFDLKAVGASEEHSLILGLDTTDGALSYSLAGNLHVANIFSWPEVGLEESGPWQTARFPASPARTFTHRATLRFDGQRLAPAALAGDRDIALMVDIDNTVTRIPFNTVQEDERSWRAFALVRLLPMVQFKAALDAASLPPASAELNNGATAYSPLSAKQAQPLIGYQAARHIFHRGAANAGGLSGALAAQIAAHLESAPTPALAIDLSSHVILAFGDGMAVADKLRAPLVLTSIPGVAFVTPEKGIEVLPAAKDNPVHRALACAAGIDRTLYLAGTDGFNAHRFPPLEPRLARFAATRLQQGFASRRPGGPDLATRMTRGDGVTGDAAHQPVFQAVVFREEAGKKSPLASGDYPAAATAFHLSAMFSEETDIRPLAIGFGGAGRIDTVDLFGSDDWVKDGHAAPGTVFDAGVYRRAIGCFRDWAARNVVPGPDLLTQAESQPGKPALTIQVEALSRDGAAIITVGKLVRATKDVKGDPLGHVQQWAERVLQRAAPWAAEGILTARTAAFGMDGAAQAMLVRVDVKDYVRPERSEPLPQAPLPAQPQFEPRAAMHRPAAGATAGYIPIRVAPAFFLSDKPGKEPRLAANGVTVSWALDSGSGAILEAGPGCGEIDRVFDDLWITDRERMAVRPSKPAPKSKTASYELTFALPDGYRAAMPRALSPAAYPVRLAPEGRHAEFEQSYAPARVSTSRIAARAGAWTASRTGLAQIPSDVKMPAARSSETPVHVRQPRPAPLALNDRTRPSSHEAGRHVAVAAQQDCVVHGPRAMRAGGDVERVGLNRAARSLWATRLTLDSPGPSIITQGWDGSIVIKVDGWLGHADKDAEWMITSASLIYAGDRYLAKRTATVIDLDSKLLRFDGFSREIGNASFKARDVLVTLAALADVDFELNLTFSGDGVSLNRQVRFHLYAGAPYGVGVEEPLFFRFEDPEFNDRLGGLAKLKRVGSELSPTDDFILAADVAELRPSQRIDVALALRSKVPDGTPSPFGVKENKLTHNEKFVHLLLERLRKLETEGALTAKEDETVSNTVRDDHGGWFLDATGSRDKPVFHSMAIDCGGLERTGENDAGLRPGDQFRLTLMAYDTPKPGKEDKVLVSLLLDVVEYPNLSANPSSFAVLLLQAKEKATDARVGVHLYANGPEASMIEIVDPRDLIDGLVRRRAVYRWRSFQYFTPGLVHYFALQKINAVGGSWLPDQLHGGWQSVPNGSKK